MGKNPLSTLDSVFFKWCQYGCLIKVHSTPGMTQYSKEMVSMLWLGFHSLLHHWFFFFNIPYKLFFFSLPWLSRTRSLIPSSEVETFLKGIYMRGSAFFPVLEMKSIFLHLIISGLLCGVCWVSSVLYVKSKEEAPCPWPCIFCWCETVSSSMLALCGHSFACNPLLMVKW